MLFEAPWILPLIPVQTYHMWLWGNTIIELLIKYWKNNQLLNQTKHDYNNNHTFSTSVWATDMKFNLAFLAQSFIYDTDNI